MSESLFATIIGVLIAWKALALEKYALVLAKVAELVALIFEKYPAVKTAYDTTETKLTAHKAKLIEEYGAFKGKAVDFGTKVVTVVFEKYPVVKTTYETVEDKIVTLKANTPASFSEAQVVIKQKTVEYGTLAVNTVFEKFPAVKTHYETAESKLVTLKASVPGSVTEAKATLKLKIDETVAVVLAKVYEKFPSAKTYYETAEAKIVSIKASIPSNLSEAHTLFKTKSLEAFTYFLNLVFEKFPVVKSTYETVEGKYIALKASIPTSFTEAYVLVVKKSKETGAYTATLVFEKYPVVKTTYETVESKLKAYAPSLFA